MVSELDSIVEREEQFSSTNQNPESGHKYNYSGSVSRSGPSIGVGGSSNSRSNSNGSNKLSSQLALSHVLSRLSCSNIDNGPMISMRSEVTLDDNAQ